MHVSDRTGILFSNICLCQRNADGIADYHGYRSRSGKYGLGHHTLRRDARRTRRVRLHHHDNLLEIIDRYLPTELSVEGIYFGNNAKSAIPTAQARGAALVACAYRGLEYGEYTPMQIKQALVGTGAADKRQIQYMVRAVLKLDHEPRPDHAADALAAAITHARLRTSRIIEQQVG